MPLKRSRPLRPRPGVYDLTTEALLELVGMLALRKAENRHIDIVLMRRAERELLFLAKEVSSNRRS